MTRGMNTSTLLLSLAAVPALILTAEAENTPKALTDLQLPTGDNQAVGILIEPSFSKELITMHSAAIQKLSKLSEDKIQQFQKSYNADMPMPYMAEMWESEAAYQAYIAEIRSRLGERENEIFTAMVEQSLGIDKTAEALGMTRSGTLTAWYRLRTKLGEILKNIF